MKRFPLTLQHDAMQCGVACLQMVCRFYGLRLPLDRLSELCVPTHEGVSMLGISQAARQLGLQTACGRITPERLSEARLPCILHWEQNHFVVLYDVRHSRHRATFRVADPAKGCLEYTEADFERHWVTDKEEGRGIALFLRPDARFRAGANLNGQHGGKDKSADRTHGTADRIFCQPDRKNGQGTRPFSVLLRYVRTYRRSFLALAIALLGVSFIQLAFPFLTQAVVDRGIARRDVGFIGLLLMGMLVLTVSRTAIDFVRRRLLLRVSLHVNLDMLSDFFTKLLRLPMAYFDTKLLGDLLQRMADHRRVEQFLTTQMLSAIFAILTFAVLGGVLLAYSAAVFALFVAGSALYVGWLLRFLPRRKALDYALFQKQAESHNRTNQLLTAIQEIKLQDCERRRCSEWEDTQVALYDVQQKALRLRQAQEAGCVLIHEVQNAVITVVAALAIIRGDMTLGMMLAVQYILGQLNGPIDQIMSLVYALQDVRLSLERIDEVHRRPDENARRTLAALDRPDDGIRLLNVGFRYDKHAPGQTLSNISLTIPYGRVTAIVGASGSGKTTLVKLLLGFYAPENGNITVGNTPLEQLNLHWWRRQCGVVMQDGVIFSEAIARNVAVDDGPIDPARLAAALDVACCREFVDRLPLHEQTLVGPDGHGLSQGQKQRLLIARAVYRNPRYIFFDEATNALDATHESLITKQLADFYAGRTVIIVAHRLSTVRRADQIVVLDHGRIVETGRHDELVARRGAYYRLVRDQLELGA